MINSRNLIYTNILDLTVFETVANLILKCATSFALDKPDEDLFSFQGVVNKLVI